MDIYTLTFCHDTRRHENCRLWKNHHENTIIGSTIVDATEHRGLPKASFYASNYIMQLNGALVNLSVQPGIRVMQYAKHVQENRFG